MRDAQKTIEKKLLACIKTVNPLDLNEWISYSHSMLFETDADRESLRKCSTFLNRLSTWIMPAYLNAGANDTQLLQAILDALRPGADEYSAKTELAELGKVFFTCYANLDNERSDSFFPIFGKLLELWEIYTDYRFYKIKNAA